MPTLLRIFSISAADGDALPPREARRTEMDAFEESGEHKEKHHRKYEDELAMKRLPKRLAYILRYGVLKEGLEADENGYVNLDSLLDLCLLQEYTRQQVLEEIVTSVGDRAVHRFNWCERDGRMFVRASYLRNFEKSPHHSGTKIRTLFECAMTSVIDRLDEYDLQDFPDEYIITTMIHRLKRQKKLSLKSLKTLLAPTLTHLDLEGIYLTNNVLRTVWTQCPQLVAVSLKNCGYIVTDTILVQFTKATGSEHTLNLFSRPCQADILAGSALLDGDLKHDQADILAGSALLDGDLIHDQADVVRALWEQVTKEKNIDYYGLDRMIPLGVTRGSGWLTTLRGKARWTYNQTATAPISNGTVPTSEDGDRAHMGMSQSAVILIPN